MFEYDTQITLDGSEVRDDVLEVRFPHSGVLYLQGEETQKNQLTVIVHTLGGKVSYKVPVMRMQSYTLEEIFEKKLYILLPLLRQEFESIREHLEELCRKGTINEYTKYTLMDLSGKVIEHQEEVRVERIVELLKEYSSDNTEEVVTKALKDHFK